MQGAIFFDRDGVLNEPRMVGGRPIAPWRLEEFTLVPDAGDAVRAVLAAGYLAIVVTNQPELSTGELTLERLEAMHAHLRAHVPVTAIYHCPHTASSGCGCHKPDPGLLRRARDEWRIDFRRSYVIGDRWRDIGAADAVGCPGVLLERPYSGACRPAHRAQTLRDAVDWILRRGS